TCEVGALSLSVALGLPFLSAVSLICLSMLRREASVLVRSREPDSIHRWVPFEYSRRLEPRSRIPDPVADPTGPNPGRLRKPVNPATRPPDDFWSIRGFTESAARAV